MQVALMMVSAATTVEPNRQDMLEDDAKFVPHTITIVPGGPARGMILAIEIAGSISILRALVERDEDD